MKQGQKLAISATSAQIRMISKPFFIPSRDSAGARRETKHDLNTGTERDDLLLPSPMIPMSSSSSGGLFVLLISIHIVLGYWRMNVHDLPPEVACVRAGLNTCLLLHDLVRVHLHPKDMNN